MRQPCSAPGDRLTRRLPQGMIHPFATHPIKEPFMEKVLFTYHFPLGQYAPLLEGYEIVRPETPLEKFSSVELLEKVKDATALISAMNYPCDKALIEAGSRLKAIGTVSVGFNHIDVEAASKHGVAVINTPHEVTEPTAALTMALILDITRSVSRYDRELRVQRSWGTSMLNERDMDLNGKKLGVLGFGRIGKSVARKALAFGMEIIYYDMFRAAPEVEKEFGATFMPAEDVLAQADVVTLHMPYTPENHHFINAERLALMKPTAYIVNAARGAIIEEKALVDALRAGTIRGAGLDVHENEPTVSADVAGLENVVITPHVGTDIAEVRMHMLGEALRGVKAVLNGEKPYNQVN